MSYEKMKTAREAELRKDFTLASFKELQDKFDELIDRQEALKWSMTKEDIEILSDDFLEILNSNTYGISMSGVVKYLNELFDEDVKDLDFRTVKVIQSVLTDAKFTGYEEASMFQNTLKVIEKANTDISEFEVDLTFINNLMESREKEMSEDIWSTDTKAFAADNGIDLPEKPSEYFTSVEGKKEKAGKKVEMKTK